MYIYIYIARTRNVFPFTPWLVSIEFSRTKLAFTATKLIVDA